MVSPRTLLAATALAVAARAANHTIVAQADLTFNPSEITAAEGDWLVFHFESRNHSVASGPFASPCEPPASGGFFSGYFPTESGTNANQFAVEVTNASAPIWFYCTQARHCASGMVGVVNAPANRTLDQYKAAAAQFNAAAVAPASVTGGVVEPVASSSGNGSGSGSGGSGAASLGVSVAGALLGAVGVAALLV